MNWTNFRNNLSKLNLIPVILVVLAFTAGWQFGHRDLQVNLKNGHINFDLQNQQTPQNVNLDFKLFWDTWDLLSKQYYDKKALDPQKMYYGAIQGMVAALGDPYTVFLPPAAQKNTKEELGGSFEGVGIELGYNKEKRLVVIAPLQGTPAEKAGIKPGDMIIKINDQETSNTSLPDAVSLIRGPKGTAVSLEIYHDGDKAPRDLSINRDTIVVKSVETAQKTTPKGKRVGYLKLSRFGENTFEEWDNAVSATLSEAPQAIVLDLRNNPGGFLEGAVYISSEFIATGNIVQQEDGAGDKQGYKVNRVGKLLNIPLMTMINKGSASASEIVAGAIQDNNRGKLVGEQSFGKGTIQNTQDLPGGTGIHITTAKWLTPNGRWIHSTGLTPDIKVDAGDEATKDAQLDKALESLD